MFIWKDCGAYGEYGPSQYQNFYKAANDIEVAIELQRSSGSTVGLTLLHMTHWPSSAVGKAIDKQE